MYFMTPGRRVEPRIPTTQPRELGVVNKVRRIANKGGWGIS